MTNAKPAAAADACMVDDSQLVVIDIQQRLGDAMPSKVLNRVLQNTSLLARSAALLGVPVLHTEQYPEGLGPTHQIVSSTLPATHQSFSKTTFSCAGAPGFMDAVRATGRNRAVLVGMEAHVCVLQTAMDLASAGLRVYVVEDAICSRRLENYQNALDRLRGCGVAVVSAESVVFEWLRDSKHPNFKTIQAFLR